MKVGDLIEFKLEVKDPRKTGNLHQTIFSVEPQEATDQRRVEVSSGFGCGNFDIYISVDGKRVLALSAFDAMQGIVQLAAAKAEKVCRWAWTGHEWEAKCRVFYTETRPRFCRRCGGKVEVL